MRTGTFLLSGLLLLTGYSLSLADDRRLTLSFGGSYSEFLSGEEVWGRNVTADDCGTDCVEISQNFLQGEAKSSSGLFVGVSYAMTDLMSVDFSVSRIEGFDIVGPDPLRQRQIDTTTGAILSETNTVLSGAAQFTAVVEDLTLITFGTNFHLTKNSRVDVSVGPVISRVLFDDVYIKRAALFSRWGAAEDQTAAGVKANVAVPLSERWIITGSVTYLDLSTTVEPDESIPTAVGARGTQSPGEIALDPLDIRVGFGIKF